MAEREYGSRRFELVGPVTAERDSAGRFVEYVHQLPPRIRPNRFGSGPFCRLALTKAGDASGVYAITAADHLKYIGECAHLANRFGEGGYGLISARNCHADGQSTNCKINSRVLVALKRNESVQVWFHRCSARKAVEQELRSALRPLWNADGAHPSPSRTPVARSHAAPANAAAFRKAIEREFHAAMAAGRDAVEVRAGDLHRFVGGYPGPSHRMPVCCEVMRAVMKVGDKVLQSPPRGAGANVVIRYRIPRP